MRSLIFAAAMAATLSAASEKPDLKGLSPGMTRQEVRQAGARCPPSQNFCGLSPLDKFATFAGSKPKVWVLLFTNDGVLASVMISVEAKSHALVLSALEEKFGKFDTKSAPVTTRSGASFVNQISKKQIAGAVLEIEKYAGNISESSITLTDPKLQEQAMSETSKSSATKAAKDL